MNTKLTTRLSEGISYIFSSLPKVEQYFHLLVVIWVITQVVSSATMNVHGNTPPTEFDAFDKFHIYSGMLLIPTALLFCIIIIRRRSFHDMYPWIWGDFSTIKQDIRTLSQFTLPKAHPRGLAATVEGLGLLALVLALATGSTWWLLITADNTAPIALSIHKMAVGAIELYLYGHATFAVLHLLQAVRR